MQTPSKHSGFTLIELMIVVAIVAILAAIAYPSYQSAIRKANRAEAQDVLVQMQLNQEKFRANNTTYADTAAYEAAYSTMVNLGALTSNRYTFSVPVGGTAIAYTVQAIAGGNQANDSDGAQPCGTLSIDQSGATVPTKVQGCW